MDLLVDIAVVVIIVVEVLVWSEKDSTAKDDFLLIERTDFSLNCHSFSMSVQVWHKEPRRWSCIRLIRRGSSLTAGTWTQSKMKYNKGRLYSESLHGSVKSIVDGRKSDQQQNSPDDLTNVRIAFPKILPLIQRKPRSFTISSFSYLRRYAKSGK